MKKILPILALIIVLASCDTKDQHAGETKRVVKAAFGPNTYIKMIKWVDTSYQVGDTIRVDMKGVSFINEGIIIK